MFRYLLGTMIGGITINRNLYKATLLTGWIVTSPLLLLTGLFLLNTVNPMVLMFQYQFEISNQSGEEIHVTPIGAIGERGYRRVLPQYAIRVPAIPSFRQGGFRLIPGASLNVIYDWDDINFSEILIERKDGIYKMLVVDPNPTERRYRMPSTNKYIVPRLDELPDATREAIEAGQASEYNWRAWRLICSGLLPVALFLWWSRLRKMVPNKSLQPTCSAGAMYVIVLSTVAMLGFRSANVEAWKPEPKFDVEGSSYIETLTFISGISYALTEINNELKRQSKTSFICGAPDAIGTKLIIEILNQRYIGSITSEQAIEAIVLGLKDRYPCK